MAAIRREIKEVEAQLDAADKDFTKVNDKLRIVQQDRSNVEEELAAQNTRLKQMLDELALRKEQAEAEGQGLDGVGGSKMTMAELDRKVDAALLDVLQVKLREYNPTLGPTLTLTLTPLLTPTLSRQSSGTRPSPPRSSSSLPPPAATRCVSNSKATRCSGRCRRTTPSRCC